MLYDDATIKRVLRAARAGQDWLGVAANNDVNRRTAYRWIAAAQESDEWAVSPKTPRGGRRNAKIDDAHVDYLISLLDENCYLTLDEMVDALDARFSLKVWHQTVKHHIDGRTRFGSFISDKCNEFMRRLLRHISLTTPLNDVVIVAENAPCHANVEDVFKEDAFSEAKLLRLGPYSPMLNPIENCFSTFKAMVKRYLARHRRAILEVPPHRTIKEYREQYLLLAADLLLKEAITPGLCHSFTMADLDFGDISLLLSFLDNADEAASSQVTENRQDVTEKDAHLPGQKKKPLQKERKAKGSGLPYSTELQRRRKAELQELRLEELQLRDQLNLMVQSFSASNEVFPTSKDPDVRDKKFKWRKRAIAHCEARALAQRTNQTLKQMLQQQFKCFQAVRRQFEQEDALYDLDFLKHMQPTQDRPFLRVDFSRSLLDELSSDLGMMYLGANTVVPTTNSNPSVLLRSQTRLHENGTRYFETTSVTPLACTVHEAGDILWGYVTKADATDNNKAFNLTRVTSIDDCDVTQERQFTTSHIIQDSVSALVWLEAASIYRKYSEGGRHILVGAINWLVPGEGLEFKDKFWTVVSAAPMDPTHSSVVQTYYKLEVKKAGTQSTEKIEVLMQHIGRMTRCYLQCMQDAFLGVAGLFVPQ
ncbi:Replication protein A 70 kDa DNA-binding subunit [Phytophthora cinnamomi]|uniref:Replication protein A 70 kDa DNA-binding subunit n=1 Tax=Phytophthora cinnamomi TaxID=4785 RepID=UPI003559EA0B|nr:Replication protein A 70 kDa DNA-binding subunit [Phytophthora cinnamomi]